MSDRYEWNCVHAETATAEAAITRLIRSLRKRGVEISKEEIEAARRSASAHAVYQNFG